MSDSKKAPVVEPKDKQVHTSANGDGWFISLQNGIISLNNDGTWSWSERPDK